MAVAVIAEAIKCGERSRTILYLFDDLLIEEVLIKYREFI